MATTAVAGSVASLFPHVEKNWWKTVFDEFNLRTDGDVVDDPKVTEEECQEILRLPHISQLFAQKREPNRQMRVLDLCCGHGRHSIWFAQRFPDIEFHGRDGSTYLIELARSRASKLPNLSFSEGYAAAPLAFDKPSDLVLLMGNSFGYWDKQSDMEMMTHTFGAMKPSAFLVMDIPDADWMQKNLNDHS